MKPPILLSADSLRGGGRCQGSEVEAVGFASDTQAPANPAVARNGRPAQALCLERGYVETGRSFEAILEDVDPEVAIQAHPRGDEGKYEGKDGFLRFITEWIEPFEDFTQTPEEFIDVGDLVVVRVLQRARGKGSGVPVESHFWFLHLMRDGKVIKLDLYDTETQALKAAGLSE